MARETEAAGGRALAMQGDVAREAEVLRLFERAEAALGSICGLANNAGITGRFADAIEAEAFARMLAVNVTGTTLEIGGGC